MSWHCVIIGHNWSAPFLQGGVVMQACARCQQTRRAPRPRGRPGEMWIMTPVRRPPTDTPPRKE